MSQATRDLWPDSIGVDAVAPPVVILREQAPLLGERTHGIVRAEVESTQQSSDKIDDYLEDVLPPEARVVHSHTLYLVAPALDNYRYSLLSVQYDFAPYPCQVRFHPNPDDLFATLVRIGPLGAFDYDVKAQMMIKSQHEFAEWLQFALRRQETVRIIQALVHRVQQLGTSNT